MGRVRRQCTQEYKIEVVDKAIRRELVGLAYRQRMPPEVVVYQYFGITVDEAGRAERAKRRFADIRWARPVYPFLEMGWSRKDCLEWLVSRVPHRVPRSACVYCPFHTNRECAELKAHDAQGWARAVEIDNAFRAEGNVVNRGLEQKLYLHRTCVPLAGIDFAQERPEALHPMHAGECHGMCGV